MALPRDSGRRGMHARRRNQDKIRKQGIISEEEVMERLMEKRDRLAKKLNWPAVLHTPKLGDWIKVPDGRIGTVVYSGLDGVGVKWGKLEIGEEDCAIILGTNPIFGKKPSKYNWDPDAMLRDKKLSEPLKMECVGEERECRLVREANDKLDSQ